MPKDNRQADVVLETRHLLLFFFIVVGLCGVFFALGYVVGRNTFSSTGSASPAETAGAAGKPSPMPPAAYLNRPSQENNSASDERSEAGADLSFYQSVEQNPEGKLIAPTSSEVAPPAPEPPSSAPVPAPPTIPVATPVSASISTPAAQQLPPASILVQVSALSREADAEALVKLLKERNLPVQVMAGASDSFFHVMVGPYQTEDEAQKVKRLLELDGFRPFVKR